MTSKTNCHMLAREGRGVMDEMARAAVETMARIDAVRTILDVVCRTTGMGFAAVARVTKERWIACSLLDQISFGMALGGELKVETTICNAIRQTSRSSVRTRGRRSRGWTWDSTSPA